MNRYQRTNWSSYSEQFGLTPGIKYLLIANGLVFLFQLIARQADLVEILGLTPWAVFHRFAFWQVVTYMFLHGDFFHILFNMFSLWMFGRDLERQWGTTPFLKFYFTCGIGAGIITALLTMNSVVPTIGASGAIFGVLVAFAVLYPDREVYIWFLFPVKVKYLVMFMVGFGVFAAWNQQHDGIAHFTHLGGALIGYLYLKQDWRLAAFTKWLKKLQWRRRQKAAERQFRQQGELMEEIDRILDRINEVGGYEHLSEREKRVLENASRELSEKKK